MKGEREKKSNDGKTKRDGGKKENGRKLERRGKTLRKMAKENFLRKPTQWSSLP
jgi:hypothetical protein